MFTPELTELFHQSCAALAEAQGVALGTMTESEFGEWMRQHFTILMADTRRRWEEMKNRIFINLDRITPVISERVYIQINAN